MSHANALAARPEQEEPESLIGPHDPPPYEHLPGASARALLLCDHASAAVPTALARLGLPDSAFDRHIAVDLHAGDVTRRLARLLGLPAFLHGYSRLVADANRHFDDPTLCAAISDGTTVPGNAALDEASRRRRWQQIHQPYHRAITDWLQPRLQRDQVPALISVHSFSAEVGGARRPWPVAVLWNQDGRMAVPFMARLRDDEGLLVGDNEPYSGREGFGYTMLTHAEAHGLPHLLIELRQDLLAEPDQREHWSGLLARTIAPLLADLGLYRRYQASGGT